VGIAVARRQASDVWIGLDKDPDKNVDAFANRQAPGIPDLSALQLTCVKHSYLPP